jgi:hypothetical protein
MGTVNSRAWKLSASARWNESGGSGGAGSTAAELQYEKMGDAVRRSMLVGMTVAAIAWCALTLASGSHSTAYEKAPDDSLSEQERFEIIAYCTPPADHMSVERFREMAECGFTAGIPAEKSYDIDQPCRLCLPHDV